MRRCIDVSELFNDIDNLYDLPEIKEKNQIFIDVNIYLLQTNLNTEQIIDTLKQYKCKKGYTKVILDTTKVDNN